MNKIIALLKQDARLAGWRTAEKATASYELFFVHKNLETVRATDTTDNWVTVYVAHDGKLGDSSFTVVPSMTEEDMARKIDAAVMRANLVFNEPYELPDGGELNEELPTNMKDRSPDALGRDIADAVFAADTQEGGSINACEIFLYRDTLRVRNSRGVDKTQVTHRVMIEAIPTFTDDRQSVELYEDYRFTVFDPARITAEIARKMAEVRERCQAVKPPVPLRVRVLLRPKEISELMENLTWPLNYSAVYSHANPYQIGDHIQKERDGDALTVTMKAVIPGSEDSAFFDRDGMSLTDTCVIEQGTVKNYFGASRFGQYLQIPNPSGDLACCAVAPGSLSEAEMKRQPCLECVSLSGLQVDVYTDYIGGEIRLAYYFDGEKTCPVTGITMSGKLSDALKSLRLSRETTVDGAYEGPALLLLPEMSVL